MKRWLKALVAAGAVAFFLGGFVLAENVLDKPAGDTEAACCGFCGLTN